MNLMNPTRRALALAATVALSSSLLAACGSGSSDSSDGSAAGTTTVTVGIGGNIFDTPLEFADAQGYFAKQGIKIKTVLLTSQTGIPSLESGSVQFLPTSPNDLFTALNNKLPVEAVQAIGLGNPLGLIVSTKFAKAHNLSAATPAADVAKALAGSKPGFSSPNTKAEAGIFLKAYGVDPDKLSWVSLPSPAADKAALASNQIDWFLTSEPLPLQIEAAGQGVVVADPLTVPAWSAKSAGYGLFTVVKKDYASSHADLVKKYVTAVRQATAYMNAHPGDPSVVAVAQKIVPNVSADILKDSLKLVDWPASGQMDDATWNSTTAFLNSIGTIKGGAKITAADWTNQYLQ